MAKLLIQHSLELKKTSLRLFIIIIIIIIVVVIVIIIFFHFKLDRVVFVLSI